MAGSAYDNRSLSPLRREAQTGSYQGVTPPECVTRDSNIVACAWNQNFTNSGNEGNQNANNKENTNNSVRSARRMSPDAADFSIEEVLKAYQDCRQNKRNNLTTLAFEADLISNIAKIWHEINDCAWTPSGHMCFVVESPKIREVWASPFADRVVHHVVYNRLRPRFEPGFIATSFACIPNRGTGGAASWAQKAARRVTRGWSTSAYVGQIDIRNFFPSIDCQRLCDLLLSKVHEKPLAHLVREIIMVDVKRNAHFPGDVTRLAQVPHTKSLWHKPQGIGLPIGNLTSQFGANVYLDFMDHAVVRSNIVKHYGRYVDDIVILDRDFDRVSDAVNLIGEKLKSLNLQLNPDKTQIRRIEQGFDFCGRFVKPFRTYLRRSTVKRAKTSFCKLSDSLHPAETITSYMGTARHCDTHKLRVKWGSMAKTVGLSVDQHFTKARLVS